MKLNFDEPIFSAYDEAEMRRAKIKIIAIPDYINPSKSLLSPDVIMLAGADLDLMYSLSMAIGVQRQTEMNPITIVFAGINDHLNSRGLLRSPAMREAAVWPAMKNIMKPMKNIVGEIIDVLMDGSFQKITPRAVIVLSPGYAPKLVYAIVALPAEGKYEVITPATNREKDEKSLRPLRADLSARGLTFLTRCKSCRHIRST